MTERFPLFLDFEAFSLQDASYHIEVAWLLEDGTIEAHLIKPAWDWSDWNYNAEAVHGLAHEKVVHDNLPTDQIA